MAFGWCNTAPMKIAMIGQPRDEIASSADHAASVAIVSYAIARRLARLHDVVVYARRGADQPERETDSEGVELRRMPGGARSVHKALELLAGFGEGREPYFSSRSYFRGYFERVARDAGALGPDVIHLQTYAQFAPLLRKRCPRARILLHVHDESWTHLERATMEANLGPVDCVMSVNDHLTQRFRTRFPALADRCVTLPNGIDPGQWDARSTPERASDGSLRLLFVGRVSPEKGVHVLVDAFERVLDRFPHTRLRIVGPAGLMPYAVVSALRDDPNVATLTTFYGCGLIDKIRRQVLELRTSYLASLRARMSPRALGQVELVGPLPHASLPSAYGSADLFVHSSVCYEQPMPVLEAMASGLPVVGTSAGRPEFIVEGETGLVVPPADSSALAAAIGRLLGDPDLRRQMGRAGRRRAIRQFTWDHSVAALCRTLEDLA